MKANKASMKYATLNLLLGAAILSQGFLHRHLALTLFWLGASFMILGIAYLTRRPGILGKRSDGAIAGWSWLFLLPLHLYIQAVWHFCRLLSRESASCIVNPRLIVGRRLLASEVPASVQLIVDLTCELPEPTGVRHRRDYRLFPILDATAPDPHQLREFISSLPDVPTYIHCAQGHGRTGLFAIAYLVQRGICSTIEEAEKLLLTARPGIVLNAQQRSFANALLVSA